MASIRHRRRTEPGWHGQPLGDVRTEDDIATLMPCGPDTGQYVKAVREY
jgi:hypothetical protein